MKLSRRKFFGAGAGAMIAAPSLADEAMSGGKLGMPGRHYGGGDTCAPSGGLNQLVDHRTWLHEQKARLEKTARGELDEAEEDRIASARMGDPALDQIDALRSVSRPHKRIMANALCRRREREARMMYARWELRDILKQLLK